jgi:EpsI family protein
MQFAITVLLLLAAFSISALSGRRVPDSLAAPLESIDAQIAGWNETGSQTLPAGTLKSLAPTSYLSRSYAKDGHEMNLFVVFYAQQRAGESMHSPKACLPASGWEIWKHESATIPVHGTDTRINKYYIQSAGRKMTVFYWYQSKRRLIADEYSGKLLLILDTLHNGRTAGGLVRIMVPDKPGVAEDALSFATALAPQVERCFRE